MSNSRLKERLRGVLLQRPLRPLLAMTGHGVRSILMLHRFRDGVPGRGMEITALRAHLAWLRRERYQILSLPTLLQELREGRPRSGRAVVITIDDGYHEVAELAAPVLAEFDAPATTFVVSGFLDGRCWLWWDQLEHAFLHTTARRVDIGVAGRVVPFSWETGEGAARAAADLAERLQWIPDPVRRETMTRVLEQLEVDLPVVPPPAYRPMSWDAVRRCAGMGMTFGPHTVSHPILAALEPAEVVREIAESWSRLRQETGAAVPVFCYPNGAAEAQERWYADWLRSQGFAAALTTIPGYASAVRGSEVAPEEAPYFLPRFAWPETLPELAEFTSGFWRLRRMLRGPGALPFRAEAC